MRWLSAVRPVTFLLVVFVLLAPGIEGAARAQQTKTVYAVHVNGLSCPFCAYGIEKQLLGVSGVAAVKTDIAQGTVTVTMKSGATMAEPVAKKAVEAAGFSLRRFEQLDVR